MCAICVWVRQRKVGLDVPVCTWMCVQPTAAHHSSPPPIHLLLPLDVGFPEFLNAPSLAEICLKPPSERLVTKWYYLHPSVSWHLTSGQSEGWGRKVVWFEDEEVTEEEGCGRWTSVMWGSVTCLAKSLHPGKPSCVLLLLSEGSGWMGEGWQVPLNYLSGSASGFAQCFIIPDWLHNGVNHLRRWAGCRDGLLKKTERFWSFLR